MLRLITNHNSLVFQDGDPNAGKDLATEEVPDMETKNRLSGMVVDIMKGHGFIQPDYLPQRFTQKDVFFSFSKVIGPKIEIGNEVIFKLNPTNFAKPEVEEVYISSLCPADIYRPRSEGDNALGSVRPSVRLFVCLRALSCLNRFTYDLDFWYGGRP